MLRIDEEQSLARLSTLRRKIEGMIELYGVNQAFIANASKYISLYKKNVGMVPQSKLNGHEYFLGQLELYENIVYTNSPQSALDFSHELAWLRGITSQEDRSQQDKEYKNASNAEILSLAKGIFGNKVSMEDKLLTGIINGVLDSEKSWADLGRKTSAENHYSQSVSKYKDFKKE